MQLLIFGTGLYYQNRKKEFEGENITIAAFIDNDSAKWGTEFEGVRIIPPDNINKMSFDFICLMARKEYEGQMRLQLESLGISTLKIIDYEEYQELLLPSEERKERVAVFGTGVFYTRRKEIFQYVTITSFYDNNSAKWNTALDGKLVRNPQEIQEDSFDYVCIMANSDNERQIVAQLALSVDQSKIINFEKMKEMLGIEDSDVQDRRQFEKNFFEHNKQPGISLHRELDPDEAGEPLLSVITPFYNAGKYFEQTFNCIMNQTFPWFEWIIVDDGSTNQDDIEVMRGLAEKDRRIRVIRQENQGQAGARNTGFRNAATEIVVQIDADDLIAPQYLEYVYWGLYYNLDASWAYTWSLGFQDLSYLFRPSWNAQLLKSQNYLVEVAAIRKDAWEKVGGYKIEDILYNEDWRFWLDLLAIHCKPVCLGGYLSWYRRTETGMLASLKRDEDRFEQDQEIIAKAAEAADGTITAKEFPVKKTASLYQDINSISWDRSRVVPKKEVSVRMLMIIPWMVMGGADKFNVDVVRGLSERGYEISIMTTCLSDNEWQYKFAEFTDEIYNLPEFLETPHFIEFAEYYIRSRQIDVLMVTNSTIGYYMVPHLRKVFPELCIIDYVHMEEWYWKAGGHARTSGMLGDVLERTFVCNSVTREVMIEKFKCDPAKAEVLYIGVDEQEYDPSRVEGGYLHRKLGIHKESPIIFFPCRIDPQKRPLMLIEIVKKVIERMPEAVFVVAGNGPLLSKLKTEIRRKKLSKNIICMGQCDEMAKGYRDSKLTLICSLKEGLALTAYESCAMGVPVISSDVGGQRDLIDDSVGKIIPMAQEEKGSFGKSEFDEEEVKAYAEAIREYLTDEEKYRKSSVKCRERIQTGFSVNLMVEKLDQAIRKLQNDPELAQQRRNLSEELHKMGKLTDEVYKLAVVIDSYERP